MSKITNKLQRSRVHMVSFSRENKLNSTGGRLFASLQKLRQWKRQWLPNYLPKTLCDNIPAGEITDNRRDFLKLFGNV